ncbi:hypothetical protein PQU92_16185 [Asticcacaulis sp. BYS171W]|uniref:Uncharacterized protein n=1 Tax=Asticcacaulis aquaticus TaxID=2984212 RepID=A0ABT5HXN3_9CAUL|nr:hypothetical protein [Asticcacaulis aquaticus]MDC7684824.1 hypothetical protein [Asticcacaulis aquaticus]
MTVKIQFHDMKTIERQLDMLLYAYATDDAAEPLIIRELALLISDPLPDLSGEDITRIHAFIYHALQGFYAPTINYAAIRREFVIAILAARKGNQTLNRVIA